MASYQEAKALFSGMAHGSSSWQRAGTNIAITKPSSSQLPFRGESVVVTSTTINESDTKDAILAGSVAVGLIAVMLFGYIIFCCHLMGLHNKLCSMMCWRRHGHRSSEATEGGHPEPDARAAQDEGEGSSRGHQVDGMIPLLELSTPRVPRHFWQAGALRRQPPPVGSTPPPSYDVIYNSKGKMDRYPSPTTMELPNSDVIVLWRVVVEAMEGTNNEEHDQDLPVFESPLHCLRKQTRDAVGSTPEPASKPASSPSTPTIFEEEQIPRSVPRLILDDCSGTKISLRCPNVPFDGDSPGSLPPTDQLSEKDSKLTTPPKVSFYIDKLGDFAGVTAGTATHDTGYASCSTSENRYGRGRLEVHSSLERFHTQPRPMVRRTNLNVFSNSSGDCAKPVPDSCARFVLLKYQLTPHGKYILNLNSKFATRSRRNGSSTGSYMETLRNKEDSVTEELEPLEMSHSLQEIINPIRPTNLNYSSPNGLEQTACCPANCPGRSANSSPNQINSCENSGCKIQPFSHVPATGPEVMVRVALPTGDVSSDIAATKEDEDGSGKQSYVALFKAHPSYPIQACSVQVYSGSLAVDVVVIECLSGQYDVVESFQYGLVGPHASDGALVEEEGVTSP